MSRASGVVCVPWFRVQVRWAQARFDSVNGTPCTTPAEIASTSMPVSTEKRSASAGSVNTLLPGAANEILNKATRTSNEANQQRIRDAAERVCREAGVAIVGDSLFAGSIGRTDFPGSDFDTLASSIRNKLYSLPDETRIYPGHGPSSTVGTESASGER